MSASRSTTKVPVDHHDDYVDDHSHVSHGEDYRNGVARPVSGIRAVGQPSADPARRQSSGTQSGVRSTGPTKTVTYESDRELGSGSGSGSGGGGSGGGNSNAELQKRVVMLEDQIRLLKQQNRIFLSFMQNTEQQLAELRAAQQHQPTASAVSAPSSASRRPMESSSNGSSSSAYPNNMSQGTKQVLQRSQSERHTQPPTSAAATRQQQQQQQAPPSNSNEIDQTFAPLDDQEKERLRSAKKKSTLLNLREKIAQKQQQQHSSAPVDDSRGRGYQAGSYQEYDEPQHGGYAGGSGYQAQSSARQSSSSQYSQQSQHQSASYHQQQQQQHQPQPRVSSGRAGPPSASVSRRPPPPQEDDYEDDIPTGGFGGGGGGGAGGLDFAGGIPPGADEEVETFPCPNCERRFNEQALQKHIAKQICKQKPRKVFNMAQKRLEDLAQEAREAGIKLPTKAPPPQAAAAQAAAAKKEPPKKSKWRVEHEKFMAAIQAGKQLQAAVNSGVPLSSLPPPPPAREEEDDRTPCPHWSDKDERGKEEGGKTSLLVDSQRDSPLLISIHNLLSQSLASLFI